MAADTILYAGTIGQGVWRSRDEGETFARCCEGMFIEAEVRALAAHPTEPRTLYAGTDAGLYRTADGGDHWTRLETPFDPGDGWQAGIVIWSLRIHPTRPETLFVGTCPPGLFRSQNGGQTWEKLKVELIPECGPIRYSRVTTILADPTDPETLWAGIEIDGVRRSQDGGQTWARRDTGLSSLDIHALLVVPGTPKILLAATNNDLNISHDDGATWQPQNVRATFPHAYCRGLAAHATDPNIVFLGNGNGPPGTTGSLQVSHDGGATWRAADLPVPPNSTIWTFTVSPAVPTLVYAAAINGALYRSRDGGATWAKCRHEFGELRSLALVSA